MSINNKRSYVEYTVVEPTTEFVITFDDYDVQSKDRITVTIDGVLAEEQGYTVMRKNEQVVTITPAITEGTVRLTRETDIDEPFHKFTAGALFSAKSVDENFQQVQHSQQEVRDAFVYTTNYVNTTLSDYDARIIEVESSQESSNQRLATEVQARKQGDLDSRRYAEDILGMGNLWDGISTRSVIDVASGLTQADINATQKLDTGITVTAKSGGVERPLDLKLSEFVSVKDFGAVGDGETDDTEAIEKTLTYASANNVKATVVAGDYRITRPISITGDIDITFSKGARLRVEGRGYIMFGGSQSFVGITANAITKGDKRIYISGDTSSINNGDSLCLWDDTPFSLSNGKSSYSKGEFVTVKNVGADYVEVMASIQDDYDVSVTKVYILDLANVSVDGLSAVCEHVSKPFNIIFDLCKNLKLSSPSVHGGGNSALAVRRTYGADITAGDISKNETAGSSTGTEYGLSIANCQDIRVNGGTYRSHRHAITIGGSGSIDCAIANRGILIDGVNADCHLGTCGALDSHGNTAEAHFVNCKTRGMWLGGGDITLDGCEITDTTATGGNVIRSQGFYGGTFTIRNTRIISNLGNIDTASIVQVNSLDKDFKKDFTVILDNVDISGTTNGSNISEISIQSGTDGDALPDGLKFNLISSDVTSTLKNSRAIISLYSIDNKKINSDIIKAVNYKWIANTHPLRLYNCDTNAKVLELPSVLAYRVITSTGTNTLTPLGGYGTYNGKLPLTGIEKNVSVTASIVARHKNVPDGDTLEQYTGGGIMSVIVGEVLSDRTYFIVKSTEVIPTGSIFDVYLTVKYIRV